MEMGKNSYRHPKSVRIIKQEGKSDSGFPISLKVLGPRGIEKHESRHGILALGKWH